jgi:hypothetical protein
MDIHFVRVRERVLYFYRRLECLYTSKNQLQWRWIKNREKNKEKKEKGLKTTLSRHRFDPTHSLYVPT